MLRLVLVKKASHVAGGMVLRLTMHGDVDSSGVSRSDGTGNVIADLAPVRGVNVFLRNFILELTLNRVQPTGPPGHQGNHVHLCADKNTHTDFNWRTEKKRMDSLGNE